MSKRKKDRKKKEEEKRTTTRKTPLSLLNWLSWHLNTSHCTFKNAHTVKGKAEYRSCVKVEVAVLGFPS